MGKGTIIIIDEDRTHAGYLDGYLRGTGFEVALFDDGLAGLRAVHEQDPDIVVVGGDVPLSSGQTVIQTLRRTLQGRQLPIVVCGDEPIEQGNDQADFYLRKPFQMTQIGRVIDGFRQDEGFKRPESRAALGVTLGSDIPERGKLEETSFAQIFAKYWRSAARGVMALKAGSTLRRIDFSNGFPVAARSNLVTEHLLRFLLRLGFITPEIYRKLLPEAQNQDWEPHRTLVASGAITESTLREAQTKLVREILLQCFKWGTAAFRFSPKIVPAKNEPAVALNPFEVYLTWLRDPSTDTLFNRKANRLTGMGLKGTDQLIANRHLLAPYLSQLKPEVARFDGTQTFGSIVDDAIDDEAVKSILVSFVDLGVIAPARVDRKRRAEKRAATQAGGQKFGRIRQMVKEDHARVARASNAYAVLGLAEGSGTAEVTARFQRFCRFYRPENFERIGDEELLGTVRELLAAFRNAATEVLGKVPMELPMSQDKRKTQTTGRATSEDEKVLAEVFFADGSTYLKLKDLKEAVAHFKRCTTLVPDNPKYLAYDGWATYKAGKDDAAKVAQAKQTLLSVLKLDSRNDRALFFLGCLYEDAGRLERAVDCWQKALRFNSSNYDAQAALRRVGE